MSPSSRASPMRSGHFGTTRTAGGRSWSGLASYLPFLAPLAWESALAAMLLVRADVRPSRSAADALLATPRLVTRLLLRLAMANLLPARLRTDFPVDLFAAPSRARPSGRVK